MRRSRQRRCQRLRGSRWPAVGGTRASIPVPFSVSPARPFSLRPKLGEMPRSWPSPCLRNCLKRKRIPKIRQSQVRTVGRADRSPKAGALPVAAGERLFGFEDPWVQHWVQVAARGVLWARKLRRVNESVDGYEPGGRTFESCRAHQATHNQEVTQLSWCE